MSTTEAPALTPKQQQVVDLLEKGLTPAQIAKKMKLTSASGVYGHMRQIRKLGVTLPNETPNGDLFAKPTLPPMREPSAPTANGAPADPVAVVKEAIMREEQRQKQISGEVEAHNTAIAKLTDESGSLDEKLAKYRNALAALTA